MSQLFVELETRSDICFGIIDGRWHLQLIKFSISNQTVEEIIQVTATIGTRKCNMNNLQSKRDLEVVQLKPVHKSMIDVGNMSLVWRKGPTKIEIHAKNLWKVRTRSCEKVKKCMQQRKRWGREWVCMCEEDGGLLGTCLLSYKCCHVMLTGPPRMSVFDSSKFLINQ